MKGYSEFYMSFCPVKQHVFYTQDAEIIWGTVLGIANIMTSYLKQKNELAWLLKLD